jgi:dTDP-4-amino-4,6-dideoxygalactose transaminase
MGPIRFQRPQLPSTEAIERYLSASRREGWFSNFGPCWRLLRDRLSEETGRACVPVANATLGLMVAMAILRDPNADGLEVLMPSFAFPAVAQAAVWNRLQPVLLDVDRASWHLDPGALERAIDAREGRVGLVVALSAFGTPPPPAVRRRWTIACRRAGLPLLVDSAAGFGARAEDDVPIGAQGDAEVVSFGAVKPLSGGEGGAVFFSDEGHADEAARLIHFAFDERHEPTRTDGLNAMLSDPAAAIALASLDELPGALEVRRRLAEEILARLPAGYEAQAGAGSGTWQFVPVAAPDAETRSAVLAEASGRGIELRTYYDPLHRIPAFSGFKRAGELAVTESLGSRMLNLPMAPDLTRGEVDSIAGCCGSRSRVSA